MSQRHLLVRLRRHSRQIELSEGEQVGQRLGACSLSPVGEREADGEKRRSTVAEVAGTP